MSPLRIASLALAFFLAVRPGWAGDPAAKQVRDSLGRALPLIEKGNAGHLEKRSCFACHHQAVPMLALSTARSRGLPMDEELFQKNLKAIAAFLDSNRDKYTKGQGQGGQADTAGYALWTLQLSGWGPDQTTAAVAEYLLQRDAKLDHWRAVSNRPPSEVSSFTTTYVALRGLDAYATADQQTRVRDRVDSVRRWLQSAQAKDTEDHVFRLRALGLTRAGAEEIRAAAKALIEAQRTDGGWGQTSTMDSDAYATGSVLVALHDAGGLRSEDPAYQRGVKFLLKSQEEDGSWHVVSRSKPFQVYFESGFPHGNDQFISIAASAWAAAALALSLPPADDVVTTSRNTATRPAIGKQAMISSAHPLATQAGLEILEAGGNAFDAAVAVAATLNVVEPMMSGMGGFGVTLLYDADKGAARCLDASGRFPAAVDADVFRAPTPNYLQNRKGAKAVSTPGNANAWETLAKAHGKLPWPRLLAPAIKLADEGFIISANTAKHIQSAFPEFPEHAKAFYGKDGKPLQAGDRLVQKDLARSLRLLADQGARVIHGGELGAAIDKTMRDTGGFLRLGDLERQRAEWWDPVGIDYRGHKVQASPLPNNAWNGLLRLGIMSRFDAEKLGPGSPALLHTFAEATKLAYAARLEFAGDRDHNPPPLDRLLSEKHWAIEAARIDPRKARPLTLPKAPSSEEEQHTTHFVIADRWGNVVTSTQTLGMLFGSKVMPPGTGIWLNNSMQYCTFEPKGNPLDAIPGRRKLAGFCPMFVLKDGKPWIAVGSPGGHTIVQTVPQIVMNLVDFHMDVQQAIAASRLSFIEPDITAVEEGVPEAVRKELTSLGHNVRVQRLGNAHGLTIEYDAKGRPQRFSGGSDPRGEGAAMGR